MTCDHRLWGDPTGLACSRTDPHDTGHVYKPSSGMDDEAMEDQ